MEPSTIGLIGFGTMMLLVVLRVPVAFAMATVGIVGLLYLTGTDATAALVGNQLFAYVTNFTFVAIPLFLLMGDLAFGAGTVARAYAAAKMMLGRAPGGLAMATVAGSSLFGAVSGSGLSAVAAMGRITVPEMIDAGYDKRLSAGVVASSATIAVLVPPSIILVLYGLFTRESVGALFVGAYIPAVLSFLSYLLVVLIRAKRRPDLAPTGVSNAEGRQVVRTLLNAWGILVLFSIIAGGSYFGLFTVTEASAIAALAAFAMYLFSGNFSPGNLWRMLIDTTHVTGMVFLILVAASVFSAFITRTRLPPTVAEWVFSLGLPDTIFLLAVIGVLILMGLFVDAISMMFLMLPVLIPIFDVLDVNLIWFGILLVKAIEVGAATPPFGISVYVLKGAIGDLVDLEDIFHGVWWFVTADFVVLALLFAFPILSLWLPSLL